MASAYLKRRTWYLRYKDVTGRWVAKASRARTKTEARRMAEDLERQAERQHLGLDPLPPANGGGSLYELLSWWLTSYSHGTPSHRTNETTIKKHFEGTRLGRLPLCAVTPGEIETFLQEKSASLKPQTVNHLRSYISRAYGKARRAGKFQGQNPVTDVPRRRVHRRKADYLREYEVPLVLAALPERWLPLFAVAVFAGLRKGELLGLRKSDVDLENRLLTVGRSYDRDTTKGGTVETIPIAAELVPFLRQAVDDSPSNLVFPGPNGKMRSRQTPVEMVLRRAMANAGIVEGFEHVCRKKLCGHSEAAKDAEVRHCPTHGMRLWPKSIVRPIRFHDLRHTTASLLMMRGANPAAVQRILRHSDPKITTEIYGHLAPGYLRSEADRLSFGFPTDENPPKTEAPRRVTRLLPDGGGEECVVAGDIQKGPL